MTILLGLMLLLATPSPIEEVTRINSDRREALENGDATRLAAILADDLTYVGPTGKVETKDELLSSVRGGFKTGPRVYDDARVRVYGSVAVVTYVSRPKPSGTGPEQRSTCVYVKSDGRWQLVAQQTTRRT